MKLIKKKTRRAIAKSVRKVIDKHGPEVAASLATAGMTALAALVAANPKKSSRQLKKVGAAISSVPGGQAIVDKIPALDPDQEEEEEEEKEEEGSSEKK